MIRLTPDQITTLKSWFLPERVGPLVGSHVMHTGMGVCFVDRWPSPRLGKTLEDIGVVTEPGFRWLGLSTACARALCNDIRSRGHRPSWTTSPDNPASVRAAEKLGFVVQRYDQLYVVGVSIPG